MIFHSTDINGVFIIDLEVFKDNRGGFARTFCQKEFKAIGFNEPFVQMNHSFNLHKGTLRGMHFQHPPHQETKLIRCIKGKVMDVIVDIRKESPTFLQHLKVELSSTNKRMVLIPEGCAHGFQTLEKNTELIYHHTAFYEPNVDGGLHYNDPLLNITWENSVSIISDKDKNHPLLDTNFRGI